jgi:hypothetical protein
MRFQQRLITPHPHAYACNTTHTEAQTHRGTGSRAMAARWRAQDASCRRFTLGENVSRAIPLSSSGQAIAKQHVDAHTQGGTNTRTHASTKLALDAAHNSTLLGPASCVGGTCGLQIAARHANAIPLAAGWLAGAVAGGLGALPRRLIDISVDKPWSAQQAGATHWCTHKHMRGGSPAPGALIVEPLQAA